MWPFKKKAIDDYRICYQHNKYTIQKFHAATNSWDTLYYWPAFNMYEFLPIGKNNDYVVKFDSLKEAREKVSELIPQYFSAETTVVSSYYY